jgi:branched-chain amino acid transport system ATP-binding protein
MPAIARGLMTNPRLLILDATEGLAPLMRDENMRVIRIVRQAGAAVVVVDRTVSAVLSLANRVFIRTKGQIAWTGAPGLLGVDPALMHRQLGIGA